MPTKSINTTTIIGAPVPIPIYTDVDILSSNILIEEFKNLSKIKLYNFNKIIGTAYEKAQYLKPNGEIGKGLEGELFKESQPENPGFIIKDYKNISQDNTKSWKILFLNDLEDKVNNKMKKKKNNAIIPNITIERYKKMIIHLIGKYSYYFLKWHYDFTFDVQIYFRSDYQFIKLIKTIEKILNSRGQIGGGNDKEEDLPVKTPMSVGFGLTGPKRVYNKDLDEIFKILEEFMRDGNLKQLQNEINKNFLKLKNSINTINKTHTIKLKEEAESAAARAAKREAAKNAARAAKTTTTISTPENVKWIYRGKRLPQKDEEVERIRIVKNNKGKWIEKGERSWKIKKDLALILNQTTRDSNITFKKYFDIYLPSSGYIKNLKNRIENLIKQNIEIIKKKKYTKINNTEAKIISDNLNKLLKK